MILTGNQASQESELVERCYQGDRHSFDELWERYRKRILYFFYIRAAGEAGEAEDLVQETFIRAWAALSRGNNVTSFKAWLYAIARNVAADWSERRQKIGPLESLEDHENEPTPDPPIEEVVASRLSCEFLNRVLDKVLIDSTSAPAAKKIGYLRKMAFISFYVDGVTLPRLQGELAVHARALGVDSPTLTKLNNWLSRGDILAALVRHLVQSHPDLMMRVTHQCLLQLPLDPTEAEIARLRWQKAMSLEMIAEQIGIPLHDVAVCTERIVSRLIPMVTASIKSDLHEYRKES